MNLEARPGFGKGVRLRQDPNGSAMLLVPEGALALNPPAAAALELVNGERSFAEIVASVEQRFEVEHEQARDDLRALFERLEGRNWVVLRQAQDDMLR